MKSSQRVTNFKSNSIDYSLLILLLLGSLLSNYVMVCIYVLFLAYYIIVKEQGKIRLIESKIILVFVANIIITSIVGIPNIFANNSWPYFRDMINMISTILIYVIACVLSNKNKYHTDVLYRTYFLYSSIVIILSIIPKLQALIAGKNFIDVIKIHRPPELTLALGVYLVFVKKDTYISKYIDIILSLGSLIGFVLSFSRTSILIFLILIFFTFKNRMGSVLKWGCILGLVVLYMCVAYPQIVEQFIIKFASSKKEISSNTSSWTSGLITNNWRGYEIYCAKKKFEGGSIFTKIIGWGYGTFIDAFGYEKLVTTEKGLPYLHNGYYTVLIKSGIIGIFNMIVFYASSILTVLRKKISVENKNLFFGMIVSMIVSSWFIGGIYLGGNLTFWIFYVGLLGSEKKRYDKSINNNN